ncbi:class I SAM-dependent methyltransferase [Shimia ponticola]|uniref:class I SAM-dependent methyltransferase n=1 Tax=Shimia ponticola TaxID=2582893 RepID=UPI0011BE6B25|nr:class I SAM-dependent methyltransferase [Shimia ponticola]
MSDEETLNVYNAKIDDYVAIAHKAPPQNLLDFIAAVHPGGTVVDLGCGPGFSAQTMAEHGLKAEAWDLSDAMIAHAATLPGVRARKLGFDDLPGTGSYDGIYASFSLLHAPRADVPRHIATIAKSLRPGGVFHLGMKLGEGEHRDGLGRRYCYFSLDELLDMLTENGLTPVWQKQDAEMGLAGTIDPYAIIRSVKDA